jgi:tRNA A37 threonylcarbamoyladenosine biosynthesis protein TsaE
LQGSNFDIGAASAVNFNHTGGAGSATLVRIIGPQTTIEGALDSPTVKSISLTKTVSCLLTVLP